MNLSIRAFPFVVSSLLLLACAPTAGTGSSPSIVLPREGSGASTSPSPVAPGAAPVASPAGPGEPLAALVGSVLTIAGTEEEGFADGLRDQARFRSPRGIAVHTNGTMYVADTQNHRIRRITPDGQVSTVAGDGQPGFQDGPGATSRFEEPQGLAIAPDGTLYVADSWNGRIRRLRFEGDTATVSTVVADLHHPVGLARDSRGDLIVADRLAHVVYRISGVEGQARAAVIAGAVDQPGDTDGSGTASRLAFPVAVAVRTDGTIFFLEEDGCRLRRLTPGGEVQTMNQAAGGCGNQNGLAGQARFLGPSGLAVAPDGALYIADTDNRSIRRLPPDGTTVETAMGGEPGFVDGPLAQAAFLAPRAVTFDAKGDLFLVDAHTVRTVGF